MFTPFCFCFYFTSCLNLCKLTVRLLPEEEHSLALTQARVVALTQGSRWPFALSDNEHLMWDTFKAFSHHFWGDIAFTDNSQIKRGFRLGWGYIYIVFPESPTIRLSLQGKHNIQDNDGPAPNTTLTAFSCLACQCAALSNPNIHMYIITAKNRDRAVVITVI